STYAADREHWVARFADAPAPTGLADRPATPAPSTLTAVARLDAEEYRALAETARQAATGWAAMFFAAVAVYVHRVTGARDVLLSMPVSGRKTKIARRVPGMLSNTLPL